MHLGQSRDPPMLDTLDEPQLPQRPVTLERVGHQTADQLLELATPSRRGHRNPPEVEVEVEVGVRDEPRPIQTKRRTDHPVV